QAEDGIRGRNVTGVQTCALPICGDVAQGKRAAQRAQQLVQARILNVFERAFLDTFEFHADREVVAAAAAAPARRAGVPRAPLHRSEERRVGQARRTERARAPYRS